MVVRPLLVALGAIAFAAASLAAGTPDPEASRLARQGLVVEFAASPLAGPGPLTEDAFAARMARRLFDADMPADSIKHYLDLAGMCPKPVEADDKALARISDFVERQAGQGTPRNKDTFRRMREAIDGIRAAKAKAARPK